MRPVIQKNGQPHYGLFEGPVDFNHQDFILRNFFGKPVGGLRRRLAFHAFNFLGVRAPGLLAGVAAVDLGYGHLLFAYAHSFSRGTLFSWQARGPGKGKLSFPKNPDEYTITYEKGKNRLLVEKSHADGRLFAAADLGGRFKLLVSAPYGFENQPLRVLNPSEPFRWTFTEKAAPVLPEAVEVVVDGEILAADPREASLVVDWSGGFMRRETNWYWAAFSTAGGGTAAGQPAGANFAALTNESFYAENAFWTPPGRTRVPRVTFSFDVEDLYKPWRVADEKGLVDLTFTPSAERGEKVNALLIKSFFRQFFGVYRGVLRPPGKPRVEIHGVEGFAEFHRALW
ncbi:MAG: DUF2804 domain-containing protein [Deltaproteobacteria bacterium]|nr:DUF2804 domain-containing protein [Deltaproteobacteria bacterium]